jgi:heme/copper-type cytochrome/quinol oxidase subunit 4
MILPIRARVFSSWSTNVFLFGVTVVLTCIIGILWIVFFVDQIRYWILTPIMLYLLATINTGDYASIVFNDVGGFMTNKEFAAFLFIFVFICQAVICIIKGIIKFIYLKNKGRKK